MANMFVLMVGDADVPACHLITRSAEAGSPPLMVHVLVMIFTLALM